MRGLHQTIHYVFVAKGAGTIRGIPLRLVEWRARRLRDPVERLQFLRDKAESGSLSRNECKNAWRHAPAPAVTLGLALAGAVILRPWGAAPVTPPTRHLHPATLEAYQPAEPASPPRVWLVETTKQSDVYSNGLRVENQFVTSTAPRKYLAFGRAGVAARSAEWRTEPAGIVFHTTESHLAPFNEDQNTALRRAGEGLLEYVNRRRAYHFVIDRFGRVFRVVQETDYANHAGNSVWADDSWIYLNLNQSFFGVAFEAQSSSNGKDIPANAAQIHAGRILVEMLRARYAIPASNCVAHAQVSVNPSNGQAGYHTDWAANLPFQDLALGNNYAQPLPSLALFGFEPDVALIEAGGALQSGIETAEQSLQAEAQARNLPVDRYRRLLQQRYREAAGAQRAEDR